MATDYSQPRPRPSAHELPGAEQRSQVTAEDGAATDRAEATWADDASDAAEAPGASEGSGGSAERVMLRAGGTHAGMRLDRFVADMLAGHSRSRVQKWIALGAVLVDGRPCPAKRRLAGHEAIEVQVLPDEADCSFEPDPVPLSLLFENDSVLVIDKPAGMVVHPASGNWRGTLMNGLLYHRPALATLPRAGIVHRLDKDTSGLMVVAKREASMLALVQALAERSVMRRYLALAFGEAPSEDVVDAPIGRDLRDRTRMAVTALGGARQARTRLRRLALGRLGPRAVSLLECTLETGRTHQIRVHLAHIGLPLVGDPVYGREDPRGLLRRQALHAWQLAFVDPGDGSRRTFISRPPVELVAVIESAGIDFAACWARLTAEMPRAAETGP